jgi:hypothetical protein
MREDAGKSRFCKPWKVYENTGGRYGKKMLTVSVLHILDYAFITAKLNSC